MYLVIITNMPIAVIVGGSGALGGAFISHLNTLNYVKMYLSESINNFLLFTNPL